MSLASGNVIVTTDKIVDGAVTAVKLADDYVNVTGDTMTGDLFISNSVLPAIRLCNSTAASTGFRITSQAGGDARLDVTDNVGSFAATVAGFSAAGAATFALVPKVTGAQDTSDTALTRKDYVDTYVQSRLENLVTNNTGLFENNTNFSTFTYDATESFAGAGSFAVTSTSTTKLIDELLPINVNSAYTYSATIKEKTPGDGPEQPNFYMLVQSYDSDKSIITARMVMWQANTDTTLAADLNNGDSVIVLTDSTNWNDSDAAQTYKRGINIYGYTNSGGHTYDDYTYTRNNFHNLWAGNGSINFGTDTITLDSVWAGGSFTAGTAVTNSNDGVSYIYPVGNTATPADWTTFAGTIEGLPAVPNGSPLSTEFRWGTAFVQPGFLLNRDTTGTVTTLIDAMEFGLDIANHTYVDDNFFPVYDRTATIDADDLKTPQTIGLAGDWTNVPTGYSYGTMIVTRSSTDSSNQIIFGRDANSDRMSMRGWNGTSWTSWVEQATQDYVDGIVTYEQLDTNDDVGTAAGQLAIGNHIHGTGDLTDDGTYVKVLGDTMTGNLTLQASVPRVQLFDTNTVDKNFVIQGQLSEMRVAIRDDSDVFVSTVCRFLDTGNIIVSGTVQDTSAGALTRKDYVDALNLFNMQFLLPIGSNDTFTLLQSASFGFTIDKAYYQTASGTITSDIKIEGTSVTGLSALAVSSTEGNASSTAADTVSVGGKVTLVTTANTAGTMTSVMLECTRT